MLQVAITTAGFATPPQVLDNAELIRRYDLDTTPEWIEDRTGIRTRHWLADDQTTSDLLVQAAERILATRGIGADEIDRLIVATISPDMPSPSTATVVGRRLGIRCPAFDLSAACAGFLYGLDLGAGSIRAGDERVLVLAADARSRFIDRHDRRAAVLFADAAAGALLEPADAPGILAIRLGSEGGARMGTHVPAGGAARPTTEQTVRDGLHHLVVDAKEDIFATFLRLTRECCDDVLEQAGLLVDDIDVLVPHQGNARLVELVAKELGVSEHRVINDVHRHGNTSGASVPLALAEALADGRIRPGHTVLLTAVGAGYVFGAAVVRF